MLKHEDYLNDIEALKSLMAEYQSKIEELSVSQIKTDVLKAATDGLDELKRCIAELENCHLTRDSFQKAKDYLNEFQSHLKLLDARLEKAL